jgi:hypothetical protein
MIGTKRLSGATVSSLAVRDDSVSPTKEILESCLERQANCKDGHLRNFN